MSGLEELCERASAAADRLGRAIAASRHVRVVSHNDVDGISAGTLIFLAVRNQGGSSHLGFSGHFYAEDLAQLLSSGPEFLAFCDMGSDLVPALRESDVPYVVIDHHPSQADDEHLVNPSAFGVDGTREVSASGLAYLVAKSLNPSNISLSPIALCGAFGDMQGVEGINEWIAADAESAGLAKERNEIRLIGRIDRPVEYSITYSTLPFVKGLSGNPLEVSRFLKSTGIDVDPKTSIADLDDEMERLLISSLVERMVGENASTFEAEKLFGQTLRFPGMLAATIEDAVDYVESCGALGEYASAAAMLSGDPGSRDAVERCRLRYKGKLFEGVGLFRDVRRLENVDCLVLDGWSQLAGKLSSIYANAGFSGHDRPVFTLSVEQDWIKVSARVNPQLVEDGLDLGKVLTAVAGACGGSGGGHNVAAGGRVPKDRLEEFVRGLDREVELQLAGEEA